MNFISLYDLPIFLRTNLTLLKEKILPTLTIQQKRIALIASVAFGCLATCYLLFNLCFRQKHMTVSVESLIEDELPLPHEPPNPPFYMLIFYALTGKKVYGKYMDYAETIREGEFQDGALNGQGKITDRLGNIIEGQFKNDLLNGQGKFSDRFGNVREGLFKEGKFIKGKCYDASGPIDTEAPEEALNGKYMEPSGSMKEGVFNNHMLNGQGKSFDVEGNIREGEFKDNKLHGHGKRIFPDQMVWEGEFIEDKFTGIGTISFRGGEPLENPTVIKPEIFKDLLMVLEQSIHPDQVYSSIIVPDLNDLTFQERSYLYETIKGLANLNENLAEFKQKLKFIITSKERDGWGTFHFHSFRFHINENLAFLVEEVLHIFEKQYEHHQNNGTLTDFLKESFSGACFEARAAHLQAYHTAHPIDKDVPNLDLIVDYSREDSFNKILLEELRVYNEKRRDKENLKIEKHHLAEHVFSNVNLIPKVDKTAKLEDFKKYLLNERQILEIEGCETPEDDKIRKINCDDLDKILTNLRDNYYLLE